MRKKNFGLVLDKRRATDWQFGGVSGIENSEVLREDGQWDSYLPPYETQHFQYFDSMSCVSFSALNCVEALIYRKYDAQVNLSDRFTATVSGTTDKGNSFFNVAEAINKKGVVMEEDWPYLSHIKTRLDYFAEIPESVLAKGLESKKTFKINYEFVWDTPEKLMEALKYAPIQVGIYAYCGNDDIVARCDKQGNHAIMLYGYKEGLYWKLYDHYENKFRKVAWDYRFWGALKYHVEKVNNDQEDAMAKFTKNTLYQYVDPPGGFLLMIGGKLRHDSLDKLLASWLVAVLNDKEDTDGLKNNVGTLTKADIAGIDVYNLKGEKIDNPLL